MIFFCCLGVFVTKIQCPFLANEWTRSTDMTWACAAFLCSIRYISACTGCSSVLRFVELCERRFFSASFFLSKKENCVSIVWSVCSANDQSWMFWFKKRRKIIIEKKKQKLPPNSCWSHAAHTHTHTRMFLVNSTTIALFNRRETYTVFRTSCIVHFQFALFRSVSLF